MGNNKSTTVLGSTRRTHKLSEDNDAREFNYTPQQLRVPQLSPQTRPVLDGSLQTIAQLKVLQGIRYDSALIHLLPIGLDLQIKLKGLLAKLEPVIQHHLTANLYPTLLNQTQLDRLRPFLVFKPNGAPDLEATFMELATKGRGCLGLQTGAVVGLACQLMEVEVILEFWETLLAQEELKGDAFYRFILSELGILIKPETGEGLSYKALKSAFENPPSFEKGVRHLLSHLLFYEPDYLRGLLFNPETGLLPSHPLPSSLHLPLARALVGVLPSEWIYQWGLNSKHQLRDHLALWLEYWPTLHETEQIEHLLDKWYFTESESHLVDTLRLVEVVCETQHLCLLSDLLDSCPIDYSVGLLTSLLSQALVESNETILVQFFQWAPKVAWNACWDRLLEDFVHWTTARDFASHLLLVRCAPHSFAHELALQIVEEVLFSRSLPSSPCPSFDQLDTLWLHSDPLTRDAFLRVCLESCIADGWDWDAFAWIWKRAPNLERRAMLALAGKGRHTRPGRIARSVSREGSTDESPQISWSKRYNEIILCASPSDKELADLEGLVPIDFWDLLEQGQPRLFLLLWKEYLIPQEREELRARFLKIPPKRFFGFIGLAAGQPLCLQVILDHLLCGRDEVREKFLDALLEEYDLLSDYAAAPADLELVASQLIKAVPDERKLEFLTSTLSVHCPALPASLHDPISIARHNRTLLPLLLMERLPFLPHPRPSANWKQLLKFLACHKFQNIRNLLVGQISEIRGVLSSSVLMEIPTHNSVDCLPCFSPDLEDQLIDVSNFWNSLAVEDDHEVPVGSFRTRLLRIDSSNGLQGLCIHSLNPTAPMQSNGRRQDPKWLEYLFQDFWDQVYGDVEEGTGMAELVEFPSMGEWEEWHSSVEKLSADVDSFLLLLEPGSSAMFDESLVIKGAKRRRREGEEEAGRAKECRILLDDNDLFP